MTRAPAARWLRAASAGLLLAWSGPARACPVCFGSTSAQVLDAYYASVLLLSLLPLAMIAGFAAWLYALSRRHPAAE